MIYRQRNLLSFVLVSIVERAQEAFSVLVNVSLLQAQLILPETQNFPVKNISPGAYFGILRLFVTSG